MAYTLVPTELIVDGAITSAKLDTNLAISGTLGVTGEVTLATHLIMGDNDKIKIGTGGDLEIYHDGSNSYISNSTGNIYLGDTNGSVHIQAKLNEESIVAAADGAVSLYHDNAVKLATSSAGVTVTGALTSGAITSSGLITATSLDISGDIDIDGTTNLDVVDIDGAVDMASTLTMSAGGTISAGGANDLVLNAGASGTPDIYLQSGGGTKVKIEGSDNTVTIGLNNSSSSNLTLYGATSAESQIFFGNDGTNGNKDGAIRYFHEAHGTTANRRSMTFSTANTERMRVNATGVGIGVSPSHPLHITKEIAGYQAYFNNDNGSAQGVKVRVKANDSGNFNMLELVSASTGSDVTAMIVRDDGNVGIGTGTIANESDHKKLKISGASGTGAGIIEFADGSNNIDGAIFSDDGNLFIVADRDDATASSSIRFRVDGSSEKMRIKSDGQITTQGDILPGADVIMNNGRGISFTATANSSGSMSSELLDDYEEGTWTPTFSGATLAAAEGWYTKIGNQVTVHFYVVTTGGLPSSGTQVQVGALPYTVTNSFAGAGSLYVGPSNVSSATGGGGTIVTFVSGGEAFIRFVNVDTGVLGYTLMGELEVSANNSITAIGTMTYQA